MTTLVGASHALHEDDQVVPRHLFEPIVPLPAWKRSFDVFAAVVGLVVCMPLFAVLSLAIVVDSRGGPIFRQTRVGQAGKCFTCWKFRSMHRGSDQLHHRLNERNEAQGLIFKMKEDPRRTRVGKFLRKASLDELPQLWNVLRGNMSVIGPRPPLVTEVLAYRDEEFRRLATKPGITGLWQVTLRGRHDFADMVELDRRYADELSVLMDLKILLKTVPTVLFGRGSY